MAELNITSANFKSEVLESDKPVIVDFWATWCGPCRMLGPVVAEIAEEHPEIKVGKVNVDENQDLAMKYNVMSIPTVLIFKNGNISKSFIGVTSKQEIMDALK